MAKGGYALDPKPLGFGLIQLGYYPTAVHTDPEEDALFLVLEEVNEPDDELLPVPPAPVTPDGLTIYQFDADPDAAMTYRWKGRLNLLARPQTMHFARLRALGYDNIVLKTYADGVLIDSVVIADGKPFRLPGDEAADTYEFEIIGTSTVRSKEAATDLEDILDA